MTDDGIFLRNSWYVAAWNHELIDGTKDPRFVDAWAMARADSFAPVI